MKLTSAFCACAFSFLLATLAGAQAPRTAGLESYFRAREVLDGGIQAIGGLPALRSMKTVRRQFAGDWFGSGQSQRPYPAQAPTLTPPPTYQHAKSASFIDYGRNRWLDDSLEFDDFGDSVTHLTALTAENGFETITYRNEKPFYRDFPARDLPELRVRQFRRHPEGLLLMALNRPETLQWVSAGDDLGRKQRVISFADPAGARVLLYFDAETNLLTKSETLRSHSFAGDSFSEVIYRDYRPVADLKLPFHYIDRVAGVPTMEMRASSIELKAVFPDERLRPPREFARMVEDPSEPAVEKLGDGLYLLRGSYNRLFAVFRDHIVVFEAPLNSQYSETGLQLIRATAPGKPIRYVVATHFHYDHVAGLRPFVAEGVTILTTPDAKSVIERVASARHTMHPDALSRNPQTPRIEVVAGERVLDDGTNRVELYDFGPHEHVAQLLVAYFPKQKVLFVADVWDIISTDLVIAGADAVRVAKKVQELGLQVERIIPVHGAPGTIEMLNEAVAIRAKYFP